LKPSTLKPGDVLDGRYELLRAWSNGGMGAVWLARVRGSHDFEKLFAIKTPLVQFVHDADFHAMFVDEARIIAQIRHGNVVGVEHLGEHDGWPFLALEWVQGGAWSSLIRACHVANTIPSDVMLRIAAGACAGLHAAHELRSETGVLLNVVHRDVSPQNVLIAEAGTTKIIDFGIAKARGRMAENTKTGLIKAKVEFASPEHLGARTVDRRSDVWSIGVILHYIFTGKLPFEGTDAKIIAGIMGGLTEPLPSTVPPGVADVIRRALSVDPAGRFQTAAEMKSAIESCIRSATPPETVSACLQEFLSGPLAARRGEIRDAIEEANRRPPTARTRAALAKIAPEPRVRMPTLPPELAQRSFSERGGASDVELDSPTSIAPPVPPRMRASAWILVVLTTLLMIAVWGRVVMLGFEIRHPPPAPSWAPPEGRPS
jgi:serine/threonine protein kinase